jgi:hypothetical protein
MGLPLQRTDLGLQLGDPLLSPAALVSSPWFDLPHQCIDIKLNFACLLYYEFAACSQGRTSYRKIEIQIQWG